MDSPTQADWSRLARFTSASFGCFGVLLPVTRAIARIAKLSLYWAGGQSGLTIAIGLTAARTDTD
jgi:hypothetical protein